jgi:ribonucleoside-diphosphate reductase subunit M1
MAPMPTASTAQIMGNNESTEPFTSNMYNRRVLAGEFTIVNKVRKSQIPHSCLRPTASQAPESAKLSNLISVLIAPSLFSSLLFMFQYLLKDLVERGIWTPEVRNQIIADRGSVQGASLLSQHPSYPHDA